MRSDHDYVKIVIFERRIRRSSNEARVPKYFFSLVWERFETFLELARDTLDLITGSLSFARLFLTGTNDQTDRLHHRKYAFRLLIRYIGGWKQAIRHYTPRFPVQNFNLLPSFFFPGSARCTCDETRQGNHGQRRDIHPPFSDLGVIY